jgi:hypothetical protein
MAHSTFLVTNIYAGVVAFLIVDVFLYFFMTFKAFGFGEPLVS